MAFHVSGEKKIPNFLPYFLKPSLICPELSSHIWPLSFVFFSLFSFSCSVSQSCLTLCKLMDCSTPGFPVLHHLPELDETHVHWVGVSIQPSHPWPSPSPPAFNLSQHQGPFQWVGSSHQIVKVPELQLQHQFLQWIFIYSKFPSVFEPLYLLFLLPGICFTMYFIVGTFFNIPVRLKCHIFNFNFNYNI